MLFRQYVFTFFLSPALLVGALPGFYPPWGERADLYNSYGTSSDKEKVVKGLSPMALLMDEVIDFHQQIISPVDGPRSHFKPSSSMYMRLAIHKHGFFWGYLMGCDRLLRENSETWVYRTGVVEGQIWKLDPPP